MLVDRSCADLQCAVDFTTRLAAANQTRNLALGAAAATRIGERLRTRIGVVQVFSYPNSSLAFTISGFNTPAGECVDASGNVYIVDTGIGVIQEYTNAGVFVHSLGDKGQRPVACAVRQSPYRDAVANGASGSISVHQR